MKQLIRYFAILALTALGLTAGAQGSTTPTLVQTAGAPVVTSTAVPQIGLAGGVSLFETEQLTFGFASTKPQTFSDLTETLGFTDGGFKSSFKYMKQGGLQTTDFGLNLALSRAFSFGFVESDKRQGAGGQGRSAFVLDWADRGIGAHLLAEQLTTVKNGVDHIVDHESARMDLKTATLAGQFLAEQTTPSGGATSTHELMNLNYAPNKLTNATFLFDQAGGNLHEQLTGSHVFGVARMSFSHDSMRVGGGQTTDTDLLHLEMDRNKPTNFLMEEKHITSASGEENSLLLDANWKMNKSVAMHLNHVSDVTNGQATTTNTLNLTATPRNMGEIKASMVETDTPQSDTMATMLSVKEALGREFQVVGIDTETDTKPEGGTETTQSTTSVSISNAKPLPVANAIMSVNYNGTTQNNQVQTETISGKLNGKVGDSAVGLQYDSAATAGSAPQITRAITIADQNPKRVSNFDVLYRVRTTSACVGPLTDQVYHCMIRLSAATSVACAYTLLPETATATNMIETNSFGLKHHLNKRLDLALDYSNVANTFRGTRTDRIAAMVTGKSSALSTIKFGCSFDDQVQPIKHMYGDTLEADYDYHLNADDFLTAQLSYTLGIGQPDSTKLNLQFKRLF